MEAKSVRQLKDMIVENASPATVLAITSGKGGVGKTNIAANLSICLAAAGKKVALIDADWQLANLDLIMGVDPRYDISHFIKGQKTFEQITHLGPADMEIVFGACGAGKLADFGTFAQQRIIDQIKKLKTGRDVIVLDTAAGLEKSVLNLCLLADHTLVITTTEPTSITDAYTTIKAMAANNYKGRISLLVNMADSLAEGKKVYQQVFAVAQKFLGLQINCAAIMLKDARVCEAVKSRQPFVIAYPKAKVSSALVALASKLLRTGAAEEHSCFLKKVVNWFF